MFSDHHDLDKVDVQLNWFWLRFIGCVPISIQSTEWRGPIMYYIMTNIIYLSLSYPTIFHHIYSSHFFIIFIICPPPQTITIAKFVDLPWLKYILKHLTVFLKTLITIKIGFGQQTLILTLAFIVTPFIANRAIVKYLPGVRCIYMRWENMTLALFVELKRQVEY